MEYSQTLCKLRVNYFKIEKTVLLLLSPSPLSQSILLWRPASNFLKPFQIPGRKCSPCGPYAVLQPSLSVQRTEPGTPGMNPIVIYVPVLSLPQNMETDNRGKKSIFLVCSTRSECGSAAGWPPVWDGMGRLIRSWGFNREVGSQAST